MGLGVGMQFALPTLLLGFLSAGGGHGNYLWAKVLFPYTMIPPGEISLALEVLALVQFPVYGILIGVSASSFRRVVMVAAVIVFAHAAAAVWCLSIPSEYFR
jgi:hypothetical protein